MGIENSSTTTRPPGADAGHLLESFERLGHVPQAERDRNDLEPIVGEREPLRVGFDKLDRRRAGIERGRLLPGQRQHLMREVGPHDADPPASPPPVRDRQIARPRAHVENGEVP